MVNVKDDVNNITPSLANAVTDEISSDWAMVCCVGISPENTLNIIPFLNAVTDYQTLLCVMDFVLTSIPLSIL